MTGASQSIVAADFGTTRLKFGILRGDGAFELVHAVPAPVLREEPGAAVQDPAKILALCLDGLGRCAGRAGKPSALVLTGQMGGLVFVDANGRPLTPWLTAMDTRCSEASVALKREAGARIRELSTCAPFQAERIRFALDANPRLEAAALPLLIAPSVAVRLASGRLAAAYCDRPSTCWTGLADTVAASWSPELAAAAGWPADRLPPIVEPGSQVGALSHAAAEATGLPEGLPLLAGPGDQAASLYGLGCAEPGDAVDAAATFPTLAGVIDRYAVPSRERIEVMPAAVRGRWHPLGYLLGSGSILAWFSELAGRSLPELEREAEAAGGGDGLLALPYGASREGLSGPGVLFGITPSHTRGHLYRALLEGLACEYALLAEDLAGEGVLLRPPIVSVGGGSESGLLERLKADLLEAPLLRLPHVETTAAGAALLAARSLGWEVDLALPAGELVEPDPRRRSSTRELLERYRELRRQMPSLAPAIRSGREPGADGV